MSRSETSSSHAHYPYGSGRLAANWASPKARSLMLVALLAALGRRLIG
jgi:hypothetical protein